MAIANHTFVSNIADDADALANGEVVPSHWNADHTVTLGADENFVTDTELAAFQSHVAVVAGNPHGTTASDVGLGTSSSPTFAGLTVDTDTIYVDSMNHMVGFNTTTPDTAMTLKSGLFRAYAGITTPMGTIPVDLSDWNDYAPIQVVGSSKGASLLLHAFHNGSQSPSVFQLKNRADGTYMSAANIIIGANHFGGTIQSSVLNYNAASIIAYTAEAHSDTARGASLRFNTITKGTTTVSERLRITEYGNLTIGALADPANSMTKGVVIGTGVAPASSPADAVQLYSADIAAAAGKAGLHIRSEDGGIVALGSGSVLNAVSGFTGNILDVQVGSVSKAKISNTGLSTSTGLVQRIVTKSSHYTIDSESGYSDFTVLASGTTTITLPAAATSTGRILNIKKTDAAGTNITIDGNASETIDGSTTRTLTVQYESLTLQCDGGNWWII